MWAGDGERGGVDATVRHDRAWGRVAGWRAVTDIRPDRWVPGGPGEIETAFLAWRGKPPNLGAALAGALAALGEPVPPPLAQAGSNIAQTVDTATAPEHRYHNRHHVAETVWAMAWLCRVAVDQGMIGLHQAVLGVVAMVGHDMHHDGSATPGGVLEARSRAAVKPILHAAGVGAADIARIGDLIAGTDPALVAGNAARHGGTLPAGALGAAQDALRRMANEADICASLLPTLGPRLGRLLAEEWATSPTPGPGDVATAGGRLAFLRAYQAASAPAHALGLPDARARCIAAYAEAGRRLTGIASPERGCAALDRLPAADADIAYAAALAAV